MLTCLHFYHPPAPVLLHLELHLHAPILLHLELNLPAPVLLHLELHLTAPILLHLELHLPVPVLQQLEVHPPALLLHLVQQELQLHPQYQFCPSARNSDAIPHHPFFKIWNYI